MKKHSTSLVIKEMQTQITVLSRITSMTKMRNTMSNVNKDVKTLAHILKMKV